MDAVRLQQSCDHFQARCRRPRLCFERSAGGGREGGREGWPSYRGGCGQDLYDWAKSGFSLVFGKTGLISEVLILGECIVKCVGALGA